MQEAKTLNDLAFGHSARVIKLADKSAPFRRKLLAMGVTPGCLVKAVRSAPLDDPIEVEIRGFRLCLRRHEASAIDVEELTSGFLYKLH